MGNIFCLSIAILFFFFLFLYHLHAYKEGFGETYNSDPGHASFAVRPMNTASTNLVHYNGKWNNSQSINSHLPRNPKANVAATKDTCNWQTYIDRYPELKQSGINTKDRVWEHWINIGMKNQLWMDTLYAHTVIDSTSKNPVMWKNLPFETNKIETKMNDFSTSFWLYVNQVSDSLQPIFRITDANRGSCLGVWLSGQNQSALLIQSQAGGSAPTPFPIPMKRAIFCTVVFSGNLVTVFVNGKKTGDRVHLDSMVTATGNGIEVGLADSINNYAIKDFNIYNTAFGDDVAVSLYRNNQNSNPSKVRFVRVQLENTCLHLQEIEVINEKQVNVAKTSTPSASSNVWDYASPALLIDGNKSASQGWPNSNHTRCGGMQYVELDLNADEDVKQIIIYNRPDCCQERLIGAILSLYDADRKPVADKITLTGALVQTYDIETFSTTDNAYIFFKGSKEGFTGMDLPQNEMQNGSSLLKKWSKFESFSTLFSSHTTLPSQIKLDGGGTFDFYNYKQTSAVNNSLLQKDWEVIVLDPTLYNFKNKKSNNNQKKLYYHSFNSKNQEYIHIPKNILFKEKGCTFAMWFLHNPANRNWARLFDFGTDPGSDNVLIGFQEDKLQFFVWDGTNKVTHDNWFQGAGSQWYHIAWTMNPGENVWNIYINGNLDKTFSSKLTPKTFSDIPESGTVILAGSMEVETLVEEGFRQKTKQKIRKIVARRFRRQKQQQQRQQQQPQQQQQPPPQQPQQPQPTYNNRSAALSFITQKVKKYIKTPVGLSEVFKVQPGNTTLIINDLGNTNKIKYYTKNVQVSKNTKVTLYSEPNLLGQSVSFDVPLQIGNVYEFTVKSMKIEKIISAEYVNRTKQYIGRSNWNWDEFFEGKIGDFRIFDEALSQTQIEEIYNNPKDPYIQM